MTAGTLDVHPIAGSLGAEVHGLDLSRPLSDATMAAVHRALIDNKVIVFRDQELTPEQQVALTRRFGPVLRVPFVAHMAEHPDIIAVLKTPEERGIGVFGGDWHSDFSFLEAPPMATLLYAREVPGHGGDTIWADMAGAYDALSDGMKALLDGLIAIHSGVPYGTRGPGPDVAVSTSIKMRRNDPAADVETEHPVVLVHPESGRRALFVNPTYTTRFKDMTAEESRPLLDTLYAHATRPEFTCRLRWAKGSLAIWDNRSTLHLAVNDYDGTRRLLHRTTVAGARPSGPG